MVIWDNISFYRSQLVQNWFCQPSNFFCCKHASIFTFPKSINATIYILHRLLNDIWEKEEIPNDWKEELIITVPKKGNLSECKNWRDIRLLSVPSKIQRQIILDRMREQLYKIFRRGQTGFQKNNSYTDHIASLEHCRTVHWMAVTTHHEFCQFRKTF